MKLHAFGVMLLIWVNTAFSQQAVLTLIVKQKSLQIPKEAPFSEVGLFQIYRGDSKFEQASCPDRSNKDGKLSCVITCSKDDKVSKNLRIIPPGKDGRVRGYIAPPADDFELSGCTVKPTLTHEFLYTDSRMALYSIFKSDPGLTKLVSVQKNGEVVTFGRPEDVLAAYGELAKQPNGEKRLTEIQRVAAVAAESIPMSGTQDSSKQFLEYSIGVSNFMIAEIAKKNLVADNGKRIKFTGATRDYYENINTLYSDLEKMTGRSPQQNILLNDLQKLKANPYSVANQSKLTEHIMGGR